MLTPGVAMQHDGNTTARAAKPRPVTVVAMSTPLMPLAEAADQIDYAATAFMILCASLVLLMTTPGLALFYGGMTRTKSVLNMMMMSFGAMGVVGIIYVLYGYSMSFGTENIAGIIANPFQLFGLVRPPGLGRQPVRLRGLRQHPRARLRRVPADLRRHHRRPHQRCGRRPREVLARGWSSPGCG